LQLVTLNRLYSARASMGMPEVIQMKRPKR
jgi:hypothetical protein